MYIFYDFEIFQIFRKVCYFQFTNKFYSSIVKCDLILVTPGYLIMSFKLTSLFLKVPHFPSHKTYKL